MPHYTPLLATIAAGIGLAFILGLIANRFRISPLVGYLLAGVMVGPFTPGFVADQALANELAEIGVILLMFGVGLHFSLKDLLAVRLVALPGAIVQIGVATTMGLGLALLFGWPVISGLIFGLALSVASTVVLLKALQEHHIVQTERGRIAVGWLIVEDLAMVLALVLLPVAAQLLQGEAGDQATTWGLVLTTVFKVGAFIAFMLIVGRRVIPWVLHYVAHTGSRELFRLAVLAIALGVAFGAAMMFGVSFALGAFFAGMILSESELSHQAAEETLPLRDAFAVLFFVAAGMLFDPMVLIQQPIALIATLLIILVGKSVAAYFIMRAFGHATPTALTVSASLAQIGEFSFILATLGMDLGVLPEEGRDLIIAGAIISIILNPLMFHLAIRYGERGVAPVKQPETDVAPTALTDHSIVIGFGRVGAMLVQGLRADGAPVLVVEPRLERVDKARNQGLETVLGNAADPDVFSAINAGAARLMLVAIPSVFEAGQVISKARAANAGLKIVARAHSDEEVAHLRLHGATEVVVDEQELAIAMLTRARILANTPPLPAAGAEPPMA